MQINHFGYCPVDHLAGEPSLLHSLSVEHIRYFQRILSVDPIILRLNGLELV